MATFKNFNKDTPGSAAAGPANSAQAGVQTLAAHGLQQVGSWARSDRHKSVQLPGVAWPFGLQFDLPTEWRGVQHVVYAFVIEPPAHGAVAAVMSVRAMHGSAVPVQVCAHQVLYVGETSHLKARFEGYRYGNPLPTDTDNRIKDTITQVLANGWFVHIWLSKPVASLHLPGGQQLQLPASKPLEERLIAILQPPLNVKMLPA